TTATITGTLSVSTLAISDGPTVDGSTAKLYVFGPSNGSATVVVEANANATLSGKQTATIGATPASANTIHTGSFDNNYFSWTGTGGNTGHLYVCGTSSGSTAPTLYGISFTAVPSL